MGVRVGACAAGALCFRYRVCNRGLAKRVGPINPLLDPGGKVAPVATEGGTKKIGAAVSQHELFQRQREKVEAAEEAERMLRAMEVARLAEAEEWEELYDNDGNVYYHHIPTGNTEWDPPACWSVSRRIHTGHPLHRFPSAH